MEVSVVSETEQIQFQAFAFHHFYVGDVEKHLFIPEKYFEGSLDEFWRSLPELDADFEIRRRKLDTPPCSKCMRGFFEFGMWHCNCAEYKEHMERLTTRRLEYVAASDIRGTKWCRYEPGLEDGEGI